MTVASQQRPAAMDALEQLFAAHHARVLCAAYRITGSMQDAEDVTQTVFLRLLQGGEAPIANVESYLYRAAINGALDLMRRRRPERNVPLDDAMAVAGGDASHGPEHAASSEELRKWLRQAMAGLSPRAAEMFALRYLEERSNQEIAGMMGTSQAVVAVVLYQTRARLKKQFRMMMRGKR